MKERSKSQRLSESIKDKKTIRKLLKLKGRKESKVNCIYNIFLLLVGGN